MIDDIDKWHDHPLEPYACKYEPGGCMIPTITNALEQLKFIPESGARDMQLGTDEAMARIGNLTFERQELIPALNAWFHQGLCDNCPPAMRKIFNAQKRSYREILNRLNSE